MQNGVILITGAAGFVGTYLRRKLKAEGVPYIGTDIQFEDNDPSCRVLDLRSRDAVFQLLQERPVRTVIHLAAVLPTAASNNPALATQVNVFGSCNLVDAATECGVSRFILGSSMAVYGLTSHNQSCTEDTPAKPDEIYGGAKRYAELYLENRARMDKLQTVSLRIATVVGTGVRNSASPWRSHIFDPSVTEMSIPCGAEGRLSLVHAEDLAANLLILAAAERIAHKTYNTPAETWRAEDLKAEVESLAADHRVTLQDGIGRPTPPVADGTRFAREFRFQPRPLADRLRSALRPR